MAEPLQEIHGLARVTRCALMDDEVEGQSVTVTDDGGHVRLALSTSSYPAKLTVEEALYLGRELIKAARRAEEKAEVVGGDGER